MADTITFVQGSSTLDLDDGTAYETKAIELTTPAPDVLMHIPDYGEGKVVSVEDGDRQAILRMRVLGDEWDDVLDNLTTLRQWLKEAARAELDDNTDTVYLQLKRGTAGSTATNATNNQIRFGWDEGASSIFTEWGERSEQALEVFLNLHLTPYGERATTITLSNDMFSSPHFVEDSDSDGLADGWTQAGANETLTISTAHYLIGGSCQKIECSADVEDQGLIGDVVTCAAADEVVAYVWIAKLSGTDTVMTILIKDGGGTLADSIEFNPASPTGYDKMIVAPPGSTKTWYRYVVSDDGTGPRAAANIRLNVFRDDTDTDGVAIFLVDACYLEIGTTTAPDAWMSARNTDCRNDIQSTNQATENYLNYIDVGLIPGDADALVTHKINVVDTGLKTYIMGRVVDGDTLAVNQPHWIESEDAGTLEYFTDIQTTGDGAWTDPADAGASMGSYVRYTEHAATTAGGIYKMLSGADVLLRDFFKTPHRIFLAHRTNAAAPTAVTFTLDIIVNTSNPVTLLDGNTLNPAAANTWYLGDCGYFNPDGVLPPDVPDPTIHPNSVGFYITVGGLAVTETADFDFIFAPWVGDDFTIFEVRNTPTANKELWLVGKDKELINEIDALYEPGILGSMWTLKPGFLTNRITLMGIGSTDVIDITDAFSWELSVTPRTRHLMGAL